MRTRSLTIAVICALIGSMLVSVIAGHLASAAPLGASAAVRAQDGGDEGTPEGGLIEPSQGQEGQDVELVDDLGNGGQPEGAPREVVLAGSRFLFDRLVPASPDLAVVAEAGDIRALSLEQEAPYDTVYLGLPGLGEEDVARYLPEFVESPETACPAEAADFERVDAGGTLYAFAGAESDLTADALQEVGDNNGEPVYADPDVQQPFPELFFSSADSLLRFVVLGDDGRPASIADSLAFNGTQFTFDSDATDGLDPGTLNRVGCSTAFPVFAPAEAADGGLTQLYVLAGTRYFLFTGEGAAPTEAPASPTVAPTEEATPPPATPTEVPIEVPTEVPTETPTATPAPTEVPTEVPTATPAPTEVPTETPTAAPTEAPTAEPTAEPTVAPATEAPITAPGDAGTPPAPTEASAATVAPTTAPPDVGTPPAAPTEAPAAAVTPAPLPEEAVAAGLPPEVTIQNNTYVFTQVNVDIDITTLVQVQVITIQNVEVTVYAEQNVQINQAPRLYLVGSNGQVIGQYVVVGTTVTTQPAPTAQIEPPAVVPTLPPNAPPPAASTAIPQTVCPGNPGEPNAQGVPSHLPTRIQLGGVAYAFIRAEAPDAVGTLTRIGCIGPFEAASTDQADRSQVIFLRYTGSGAASQQVYRFEVALTYQIQFQVSEQPQTITTVDQRYRLRQVWQPSIHSSTSVILFVQDPANPAPEVIYGVNVSQTVVGDSIGEYRLPGETAQPSEEMTAAAERAGLNPDLTINGQVYLLVNIYSPTGTTSNGFMTLFGAPAEGSPEMLLGRDKRELELFIFILDAPAETGG